MNHRVSVLILSALMLAGMGCNAFAAPPPNAKPPLKMPAWSKKQPGSSGAPAPTQGSPAQNSGTSTPSSGQGGGASPVQRNAGGQQIPASMINPPMVQQESILPLPSDDEVLPRALPGEMSEARFQALKKLFENEDKDLQRESLCQFADSQRSRSDSHSLRLIKPLVRLIEEHRPPEGTALSPDADTPYNCAFRALTTTLITHGTFHKSEKYKAAHYGDLGTPAYISEHLIPLYLPALKDEKSPLHTESYYLFMTFIEEATDPKMVMGIIGPIVLEQMEAATAYTYQNQRALENIVRMLHILGPSAKSAVPKMMELLLQESTVDYEGNFGYDGKRAFNAELIAAMVAIAGDDPKYQKLLLKVINRSIAYDDEYWKDKIRPKPMPGGTDLANDMQESRAKILKIMGLDAADMDNLF